MLQRNYTCHAKRVLGPILYVYIIHVYVCVMYIVLKIYNLNYFFYALSLNGTTCENKWYSTTRGKDTW